MSDLPGTRARGGSDTSDRPTGAGPERSTGDMHGGEHAAVLGQGLALQLDERLRAVRDLVLGAFPDLEVLGFRGELTLVARPEQILALLTFCRDEPALRCELLSDLSGVHWPAGERRESAQETTGWPSYEFSREDGRVEIDYILTSIAHNHWFRVRTSVADRDPVLSSVVGLYGSANFMEREVYDFFGVRFEGHPNLTRILMPDEWEGYPHRKDYPLGGVHVQYKGATVPPPDERHY